MMDEDMQPWIEEVRRDLEMKLNIFRGFNVRLLRRTVIFTNQDELWSAKTNPVIRTKEPLTPIPLKYNPAVEDITSEVMIILRDIEREQNLSSFSVLLFEVGIDRPELLPSSVELHVIFSPDQTLPENPCSRYFYCPCYLPPQPNREGTLPQRYTTRVRVRQYTFGSGTADSILAEGTIDIVFVEKLTTTAGPRRPLTYVSCSSTQPLKSPFRDIEWRLGVELQTDLRDKMDQFLNRSSNGSRTSIIFTHEPDWWITDLTPTVVVKDTPPPIPDDYDHVHFNIEEDALDYVCEVARKERKALLFVSSTRLGAEDDLQMHILFSANFEPIIWYYENREKLPLGSASQPYERIRRVDCEYRQYPEKTSDRSFLKKNFPISRKLQKLRARTRAPRDFWWVGYSQLDDLQPIANRMGSVLRSHLDKMLRSFIQRPAQNWSQTFIFTNDENIWISGRGPVIMLGEIPPMPLYYDYDSFDIVQDVADYLRKLFTREGEIKMPFYLSTLTFGEGASSQIHFLMTQLVDTGRFLYIDSTEVWPDTILTLSQPRSGGVSQRPSTSTAETGEPPVKCQRLSESGTSSVSSLESTEESPTPDPSTEE